METRKWCNNSNNNNNNETKKGPWKVEEDEVLINHVRKYGPRNWSSIRSNGLLQRTGKSCRLRWVNKLRPNLKNGVKFSAEEERVVIELQGQFGNKWAKIATHLPGRTDNDVKNFWSSRRKRLARIEQNSTPNHSQPNNIINNNNSNNNDNVLFHNVTSFSVPEFRVPTNEESSSSVLDLLNPTPLFAFEPSELLHLDYAPFDGASQSEAQDFTSRFGEFGLSDVFGNDIISASSGETEKNSVDDVFYRSYLDGVVKEEINADSFIDEFPIDMFDHVEVEPTLPSSSSA